MSNRDTAWQEYLGTDPDSDRYASERHEGFNAGWEAGRRAGLLEAARVARAYPSHTDHSEHIASILEERANTKENK